MLQKFSLISFIQKSLTIKESFDNKCFPCRTINFDLLESN